MTIVTVYEAESDLPDLIDRVLAGEEIVISRAGTPLVKLVRAQARGKFRVGAPRVKRRRPEEFADLPGDLAADFRGKLP